MAQHADNCVQFAADFGRFNPKLSPEDVSAIVYIRATIPALTSPRRVLRLLILLLLKSVPASTARTVITMAIIRHFSLSPM
jgi:hypothetical protein